MGSINERAETPFAPSTPSKTLPVHGKYRIDRIKKVTTLQYGVKIIMEYQLLNKKNRQMEEVQSFVPLRVNVFLLENLSEYDQLKDLCEKKRLYFEYLGTNSNLIRFYDSEDEEKEEANDQSSSDEDVEEEKSENLISKPTTGKEDGHDVVG